MKNMHTRIYNFILLALTLLIILPAIVGVFRVKDVQARIAGCDGTMEKWYECVQTWGNLDQEINLWCSLTKSGTNNDGVTYKDLCKLALTSATERREPQVSRANRSSRRNDDRCYNNSSPDFSKNTMCFGYIIDTPGSFGRSWKEAIAGVVAECGLANADNYDPSCASRKRQEWLHSKGLADSPDVPKGPGGGAVGGGAKNMPASQTLFMIRISSYIRWLFMGIGVLAVFGFIIAAIQYTASQDNSQSVAAAKTRMVNIIYGVLIYIMMFALLQWLIPGGLF